MGGTIELAEMQLAASVCSLALLLSALKAFMAWVFSSLTKASTKYRIQLVEVMIVHVILMGLVILIETFYH